MKPALFDYRAPETLEEALASLSELGDDAKVLAGGQSLLPLMAMRLATPAVLIDLNRVSELSYIESGDRLQLGSMTRHRAAERSEDLRSACGMIPAALRFVGHAAIRSRGTLGGSVAHADPAAELPCVLLALDGEVVARSVRGERIIPAGSFFQGFLSTSLEADEIVVALRVRGSTGLGWSFDEFSRRNGDFAVLAVAIVLGTNADGTVSEARIALSGVGSTPVRALEAERSLAGRQPTPDVFAEAAAAAASEIEPGSDLHGSEAYRRQLARVLVGRGLVTAHARSANGGGPR